MAKRFSWRSGLFIIGAIISCALAGFSIYTLAFDAAEIGTASAVLFAGLCLLPAALFGLPYFNSKFYISYSKEKGLTIAEERRHKPRKAKTIDREDHAEWAQ
jgi:hypothetical protein